MTYISKKTRLLVPHFPDECDTSHLSQFSKKRSDGRLKRYSSCDDLRAWVDDEYLNYQYFLELMSNGEFQKRPFLGLMGRFIPVKEILNILSRNASEGGDSIFEDGGKGRVAGLEPKRDLNDSSMSEATDDLLRLTDAAMTKLEAIRCIVYSGYHGEVNRQCEGSEKQTVSKECTNQSSICVENSNDMEEYAAEYNSTLTRIACLRQRLNSIQQRRDELNAKIQSSRQSKCQSSSGMTVTELYNREEQSNAKRLQKKIEKLIAEKGKVLHEMCTLLKYLNQLKKNVNSGGKLDGCPCPCPKIDENFGDLAQQQIENSAADIKQNEQKEIESNISIQNNKGSYDENKMTCRKCAPYPINETLSGNEDSSRGSSDVTFVSLETLGVCDSQRTYSVVVKESIMAKKFKLETTMSQAEQTLRCYKQRLRELSCLEMEVEELKKGAATAEYFKKRWLRSMMIGKSQKSEEEQMKREMEDLQKQNCELKKMIQSLANESEKEHTEMQRLRCKAIKIVGMQEEIMKLKDEITNYQMSCNSQNECIQKLENTVREQREEIERLMSHMTRLCRMTERIREYKKRNKNAPRSRSYGPERQNSAPGSQRSTLPVLGDEEMQHAPCCGCNRNDCNTEALNRPRSECGRRMPDRCSESLPQQTCRNQSRYN